jgi:hypothetical protein
LACYETVGTFNTGTCQWNILGVQPAQPTNLACYETVGTFNNGTCQWNILGSQPAQTTNLACYQSATFDTSSCSWLVSGTQQIYSTPISACGSFTWGNNGQIYTASGTYFGDTVNCIIQKLILTITAVSSAEISYTNSTFCNAETNLQLVSLVGSSGGIYAAIPAGLSLDLNSGSITPSASSPGNYIVTYTTQASGSCNSVSDSAFIIISEVPAEPTGLACWQSADLISSSCSWSISGAQPAQPTNLACYETVGTFNTGTCQWNILGAQPVQPTNLACYETVGMFNTGTCQWNILGAQPAQPTNLACYETVGTFNTGTCQWNILGSQPAQPTNLACYETVGTFNTGTCQWNILGSQPVQPTLDFCETTLFNVDSCAWIVSSTIQENTVNTDTISPYLWLVNGQSYSTSGTYEFLDTINCVLEILNLALSNSISEGFTNNLTLYPNPTNGTILILLPKNDQYTLNVYDSQGKLVFENTSCSNSIVHNLSSYRPGLYIFKVILSDLIYTERVIKN